MLHWDDELGIRVNDYEMIPASLEELVLELDSDFIWFKDMQSSKLPF